jgi:hypothetical protein
MPIAFSCPGCAKRYEVSDTLAGKAGRCKQCGGQFTVPVPRHLRAGAGAAATASPMPAAAPPPRPAPAPPPPPPPPLDDYDDEPVAPLAAPAGAFDDDLYGGVPLAGSGGPRVSRYRAEVDDDDEADDAGAAIPRAAAAKPAKKAKKAKKGGGKLDALPLPVFIMVGGNLVLALFLAFVVWPSMQGGGKADGAAPGNGNAPGAPAAFVPPPNLGGGGGPPQFANQAQPPAVEGFPGLPAPDAFSYPAGTPRPAGPPIGDLSQHEQSLREGINLITQMMDAMAGLRDQAGAQAAVQRIQGLTQQAQALSQRQAALRQLNAAEEAELARRMQGELRQAIGRIEQQEQQLGQVMGPGVMQMRMQLSQLKAPFQMALNAGNANAGGMAPFVEVYVANVPDGDTSGYLESKLVALADAQPAREQAAWSSPPGSSSFRIWPVSDPAGFAARIPFGRATVSGYRITVASPSPDSAELADFKAKRAEETEKREEERARQRAEAEERNKPDPEAPAGADAITKALVKLQAKNGFKKAEGLKTLARMLPEDDRRDEVIDAIEPVLNEGDFVTGEEAVKALANWHNDRADQILIHLIESDERGVRIEAIKQAGRLQLAEAAPALASRIAEDWVDAPAALRAIGPPAESAVIPLLRSAEERVRRAACEVLAEIGGKETLDTMKKLPSDPDLGVRMAANKTMQAIAARLKSSGAGNAGDK